MSSFFKAVGNKIASHVGKLLRRSVETATSEIAFHTAILGVGSAVLFYCRRSANHLASILAVNEAAVASVNSAFDQKHYEESQV